MAKKSTDWQQTLEDFFMKFPSLPKGGRDFLVKLAPMFALVFGVLGILFSIGGLGIVGVLSPFMMMGGYSGGSLLSVLAYLVSSVLMVVAFSGLRKKKLQGWMMLFWSEVVSFVGALLALSLIGGVVGAVISFYLLYQIKSYYK